MKSLAALFGAVGGWAIAFIARLGSAFLFLLRALLGAARALPRFSLIIEQLYALGVLTLLIIMVSGLFVGMVLGLQGYYQLVNFSAESSLGLVVALFLVRELGPVLGALLFAGRAGSALTAEIGLMKATEQLAAMEMMAVDPEARGLGPGFVAAPRVRCFGCVEDTAATWSFSGPIACWVGWSRFFWCATGTGDRARGFSRGRPARG